MSAIGLTGGCAIPLFFHGHLVKVCCPYSSTIALHCNLSLEMWLFIIFYWGGERILYHKIHVVCVWSLLICIKTITSKSNSALCFIYKTFWETLWWCIFLEMINHGIYHSGIQYLWRMMAKNLSKYLWSKLESHLSK